MRDCTNNKKILRRKGVSQIIGSLIMMAVVAAVGSVVLFQALNGVQNFNNTLSSFLTTKRDTSSENLIIEHIRFNSTSGNLPTVVSLWIRNIGTTEAKIQSIKIMNIDTQVLILSKNNVNLDVYAKNINSIKYSNATNWNPWSTSDKYKISVTTQKGNSFSAIASPFNT